MSQSNAPQIAHMIDHGLLRPTMTEAELVSGAELARDLGVASVCVLPYFVPRLSEILGGSAVKTSTTIGFPHGAHSLRTKLFEAQEAIEGGCQELDVVVNVSQVKSHNFASVTREVEQLTELSHAAGRQIKIIFEMCFLDLEEKTRLAEICSDAAVDWVKTSTGFGPGGATEEDVALLISLVPKTVQVKASGGVRTLAQVLRYQALGATRVGTSATQTILEELRDSSRQIV